MKKTENENKIELIQNSRKKDKLIFAGAAVALIGTNAMAAANDQSFADLFNVFEEWLEGNLGKLLALIGFAGTVIVYMMTHKGSVLFIGVVITIIVGGMVGISQTFFNVGATSFSDGSATTTP